MKVAYFDCIGGASGDMILGALLDAGLALDALQGVVQDLDLPGSAITAQRVTRGGIAARLVEVVGGKASERTWPELENLLLFSRLEASLKETAHLILRHLAEAEAHLHNLPLDQLHLHELGGADTLLDVVGAVAGLRGLGIEAIYVSALPMGRGWTSSAHGRLPLPAPATLELARGALVRGVDVEGELVTPTAAAILCTLARGYGGIPEMSVQRVGYGAGHRDFDFPNLLRLVVGERVLPAAETYENLILLETNIDDMSPQAYDHVMVRLFAAGALDVYLTPIQMKKNRPGTLLAVLCRPDELSTITRLLFAETTTLGVRQHSVVRRSLARQVVSVPTRFGPVRVKVAQVEDNLLRLAPEYDDCHRLALEQGVTWREVYAEAEAAARRKLKV